jgi:NAD-dependent DNA ligase
MPPNQQMNPMMQQRLAMMLQGSGQSPQQGQITQMQRTPMNQGMPLPQQPVQQQQSPMQSLGNAATQMAKTYNTNQTDGNGNNNQSYNQNPYFDPNSMNSLYQNGIDPIYGTPQGYGQSGNVLNALQQGSNLPQNSFGGADMNGLTGAGGFFS